MILRSLKVRGFRNLGDVELEFHDRLNLIVGDNGQGKSSLLETIYFLGTTKSFRTIHVGNLAAFDGEGFFIEGRLRSDEVEKTLSASYRSEDRRKETSINERKATLREFVDQMPLIAYSASRLDVVRGSPDDRRRFLDRGLASLRPSYLHDLSRYGQTLRQRNALLREIAEGKAPVASLEPWDHEWTITAAPVVQQRAAYARDLTERFQEIVQAYRYPLEQLVISYSPSGLSASADNGIDTLRAVRRQEIRAGFGLIGPHRDDLALVLRNRPAGEVLSSGETKMAVLFLKMAKISLFSETRARLPIFLLDDVDAELDLGIIERLLDDLKDRAQVFATSAKGSIFRAMDVGAFRKYTVLAGGVERVESGGSNQD